MRFLIPTDNKRLNELIGFLCITLAILMALALISYSPHDVALNVSAPPADGPLARNWIGPVGAYGADLLFQVLGFAAFLLPLAMGTLGWRWFRSRATDSQTATLIGYALLLLALPSLLSLWHFPEIRGAVPPGGLLGSLVSNGLLTGFNLWGANLVALAVLITALFMTTRFSFSGAHAWASSSKGPIGRVEKFGILQKAQARWQEWREGREEERMRRRLQETRISGRKPVNQGTGRPSDGLVRQDEAEEAIRLADVSDIFTKESGRKEERRRRAAGDEGAHLCGE